MLACKMASLSTGGGNRIKQTNKQNKNNTTKQINKLIFCSSSLFPAFVDTDPEEAWHCLTQSTTNKQQPPLHYSTDLQVLVSFKGSIKFTWFVLVRCFFFSFEVSCANLKIVSSLNAFLLLLSLNNILWVFAWMKLRGKK